MEKPVENSNHPYANDENNAYDDIIQNKRSTKHVDVRSSLRPSDPEGTHLYEETNPYDIIQKKNPCRRSQAPSEHEYAGFVTPNGNKQSPSKCLRVFFIVVACLVLVAVFVMTAAILVVLKEQDKRSQEIARQVEELKNLQSAATVKRSAFRSVNVQRKGKLVAMCADGTCQKVLSDAQDAPEMRRCFKFFTRTSNWTGAGQHCTDLGGRLAEVSDEKTVNFLKGHLPKAGALSTHVWLGASDAADEGKWMWESGNEWGFTNWKIGQPDNKKGEQNCLAMGEETAKWYDTYCGFIRNAAYLCEKYAWSCDDWDALE